MRTVAIPGLPPASVICLGTATYGSAIPRDDAFALLDAFAQRGGTFLDSAHVYAAWLPGGEGMSERTVGAWLASRRMRERCLVATKGAHPLLSPGAPPRVTPAAIRQDLAESLERLGIARVDLYWLHRDDPSVPVDELLGQLEDERRAGRLTAYAASNWSPERLDAAAACARARGWAGFAASQIGWALARAPGPATPPDPNAMLFMDDAQLAWYRRSGLRVVPYSSQANGYFAKSGAVGAYDTPDNRRRRERVRELARRRGATPNAIALAWLLAHPAAGCAIVGPRTLEQLADSCSATDIALTPDECAWLDLADAAKG